MGCLRGLHRVPVGKYCKKCRKDNRGPASKERVSQSTANRLGRRLVRRASNGSHLAQKTIEWLNIEIEADAEKRGGRPSRPASKRCATCKILIRPPNYRQCKECYSIYQKQWRAAHPEVGRKLKIQYRKTHGEQIRKTHYDWVQKHKYGEFAEARGAWKELRKELKKRGKNGETD